MSKRKSVLPFLRDLRQPVEWIGGQWSPPVVVGEGAESSRVVMMAWIEAPDGIVVGCDLVPPERTEGAAGLLLKRTMKKPLLGPPRRPDRIRVPDAALAAEVGQCLGGSIPITIAPTPEIDELAQAMTASLFKDADEESYLAGAGVTPGEVAKLFMVTRVLGAVAPWKTVAEDQLLRIDIPELKVEGACMSIVGYLDMSHGFLLFPSREAYEAFQVGAERSVARQDPIPDLGTDWLSFTLEPASGVSARLRREAASRGWAATDSGTYPVAGHYTREGIFRPPAARELKILLACAQALSAFMLRHGSIFEMDLPEPVCESQYDDNDLEVRLTVPYEASGMFDLTTGAQPGLPGRSLRPAGPRIARNAPCPCGSGKKYKKCHLESAPPGAEGKRADPIHDLDLELNRSLSRYGEARFGRSWYLFADDFIDPMAAIQLSLPWSLFHVQVNGKSVAEWYARENGRRIPRQTREWLAAQQAAWLSVWEVFSVQPGVGMEIRDQLSGETRFVHEVSASETLKPRDAMLARIADHQGKSFLVGAHPSLLPPEEAAEVIRLARGRLRRKRAVPVERLRNLRFSRYLIQNWEAAAIQFEHRRAVPPHLTNTAGEPLTLTTDHFELSPGSRMAVEKRLATLEGVEPPDPVEDELVYVLLQKAPSSRPHQLPVVLGRAILTETALRLETNSRERADALRARVEAACGDLVRHRAREHVDPLSSQVRSRHAAAGNDPPPAAEQLEAIREWKKTYYADWIDQPIPALGGQTPRVAAGTAAGRRDLNILLKSLENSEARVQDGTGFDFSQIRRNLRIDDAELS